MSESDARLEALQEEARKGAFDSIVLGHHFWNEDPLDVPHLHADVRGTLQSVTSTVAALDRSQLMLVLGEVGTGKTHLLRAIRSYASRKHNSLCAYSQLTPGPLGWEQHFLAELVSSLDKPVDGREGSISGFALLFDACWSSAPGLCAELVEFWDNDDDPEEIAHLVNKATSCILRKLPAADMNSVRALIYANAPSPEVREPAKNYLRGDSLNDTDFRKIRAISANRGPSHHRLFLVTLLQTLVQLTGGPFVYFIDQAENLHTFGPDGPQRALHVICDLLSFTPGLIAVIAWERHRYNLDFPELPLFLQDRLADGVIQALPASLEENEVRLILEERVSRLCERRGFAVDPDQRLSPLPQDLPYRLRGRSIRSILHSTRLTIDSGITNPEQIAVAISSNVVTATESAWTSALSNCTPSELSDHALLDLLVWAVVDVWGRRGAKAQIGRPGETSITCWRDLDLVHAGMTIPLRLFGLTRTSKGSGLLRQFEGAIAVRGERHPIGVRRGRWPHALATQTVKRMSTLFAPGGGRATISDDEFRTLIAYREFMMLRAAESDGVEWAARARVLEGLAAVRAVLDLANDWLVGMRRQPLDLGS